MSWNLALEINKLVSITRVSGSSILIYNSTGTLLASYATTGLFLGDATSGSGSAGTNSFVAPSYGSFTFGGQFANPPKILSGGGASLYYRGAGHNFENYLGTLGAQVNTGAIVASGNISSTGSVNVASVVSTGAISGTTITGTGAISGASVVSTGAISGTTITGTGAISGASVVSTGAISGTTITGTGAISGTSVVSSGAISGTTITGTGDLTIATSASIICNNYSNNGNNNVNFTAFSSGNNPALIFNSGSSNSATASGRWGYINNEGWNFENGHSSSLALISQIKADTTEGSPILLITGTTTGNNHQGIRINHAAATTQYGISILAAVGIGTGSTIYHIGFSYNGSQQADIQQLGGTVFYGQPSDLRYKENLDYDFNATELLDKIKPVQFNFKTDPNVKQYGFIAQDVLPVLPQYVTQGLDGFYQMDYSHFTGIMCKATKEQQTKITSLEAKITSLEAQLASLKATVDALVAQKEILVV